MVNPHVRGARQRVVEALPGSRGLVAVAALVMLAIPATSLGADYLYYSGTGTAGGSWPDGFIGRVNQDGTGNNPSFIAQQAGAKPAMVAASSTHLFWGPNSPFVGRANLDGSGASFTWLDGTGALSGAVAVNSKYIFYGNTVPSGNYIGRANLDGTGNNPTFAAVPGNFASSIAADESHVYWVTYLAGATVNRMSVDGTGANTNFITGLTDAQAVGVTPTHVYWVDDVGSTSSIGRANIDGSGINRSFITGLADQGSAIAVTGTKIFWGIAGRDGGSPIPGSIGVANIDGSNVNQAFVTNLPPNLYGLATQYAGSAYALTVSRTGAGSGTITSTPAGIACGSTCTADIAPGTSVSLAAKADSGSVFTGWSGACSGPTTPCAVTMSAARAVTATFFKSSDMRATVLAPRRRVVSGQAFRLAIRARNTAATTATSVTSCLRLPANLAVVRAPGALRSGRTVCFRLGDVMAGTQVTKSITVRAAATRRVTRTVAGSDRLAGGSAVNATPVSITIVPRAARARVTG